MSKRINQVFEMMNSFLNEASPRPPRGLPLTQLIQYLDAKGVSLPGKNLQQKKTFLSALVQYSDAEQDFLIRRGPGGGIGRRSWFNKTGRQEWERQQIREELLAELRASGKLK